MHECGCVACMQGIVLYMGLRPVTYWKGAYFVYSRQLAWFYFLGEIDNVWLIKARGVTYSVRLAWAGSFLAPRYMLSWARSRCGKILICIFQQFSASIGGLWAWRGVGRWVIIPWSFEIFLIFPNFLSLKSFGNSYIPRLLLIITLRFTCGEKKIC